MMVDLDELRRLLAELRRLEAWSTLYDVAVKLLDGYEAGRKLREACDGLDLDSIADARDEYDAAVAKGGAE